MYISDRSFLYLKFSMWAICWSGSWTALGQSHISEQMEQHLHLLQTQISDNSHSSQSTLSSGESYVTVIFYLVKIRMVDDLKYLPLQFSNLKKAFLAVLKHWEPRMTSLNFLSAAPLPVCLYSRYTNFSFNGCKSW